MTSPRRSAAPSARAAAPGALSRRVLLGALPAAGALAALAGLAGCSPAPAATGTTSGAAPAEGAAPANGAALDAAAFAAALTRPGTVIVDVHTPAEFAVGHLEGARNIDVEASDFEQKIGALDKSAPYAVYCRSGNRSGVAVAAMKRLGFTSTYHLAGGVGAWTASGRKLVA